VVRRRYTDEDRANALAALAANGGSIALTARQLNIPPQTLRQWARGARHPEATQMSDEKKLPLADAFEALSRQLLDGITPEKIKRTGVKDLATSAGIAVDKMQLLRGEPTEITDERLSDDKRRARITALLGGGGAAGAGAEPHANGSLPDGPGAPAP
jgi:transposase